MVETDPPSDVLSVYTAEADGLLAHPSTSSCADWVTRCALIRGNQQSNAAQLDARHEVVLPLLQGRLRTPGGLRHAAEKQKVKCELNSISQTLGVGLLDPLYATFDNFFKHAAGMGGRRRVNIDYDRQLNIPSVVQEIAALQAKLDTTEDEDEHRALEEDITGKVLWLCWCGICAEADELLPKVVDYLRREANVKVSGITCLSVTIIPRRQGLVEMYYAILSVSFDCSSPMDPGDDQAHLRRIMRDARANTSKHQLLLTARAADQAKWTGANKPTSAIDDQGTTPNTSLKVPTVSVV
ncbi:hypothetical protein EDD15DRAFT_995175 [Pisolithus albus]|nr:hypothetical protein EDD15DRAFT_995175 [Pisolithus albus]